MQLLFCNCADIIKLHDGSIEMVIKMKVLASMKDQVYEHNYSQPVIYLQQNAAAEVDQNMMIVLSVSITFWWHTKWQNSYVGAALENFTSKKCFQTVFFVSSML